MTCLCKEQEAVVTHSQLGNRRRWVFCTTMRPLYPRERTATRYRGGWVGLRADLDGTEHVTHTGMGSPNRSAVASRYAECAIQLSRDKMFV